MGKIVRNVTQGLGTFDPLLNISSFMILYNFDEFFACFLKITKINCNGHKSIHHSGIFTIKKI